MKYFICTFHVYRANKRAPRLFKHKASSTTILLIVDNHTGAGYTFLCDLSHTQNKWLEQQYVLILLCRSAQALRWGIQEQQAKCVLHNVETRAHKRPSAAKHLWQRPKTWEDHQKGINSTCYCQKTLPFPGSY